MTVTVVTRWGATNAAQAAKDAARGQAIWMKCGAKAFRMNQVFTGPNTGQYLIAIAFDDMAAYAKAHAKAVASREWQKLQKDVGKSVAKFGGGLLEREILISVDL